MYIKISCKKGFSLVEMIIATSLAGILLVMLCAVFLYGLKAIEKSRFRATAVNIGDRKLTYARKMIKELDALKIEGAKAYFLLTEGDDPNSEVKIDGNDVTSTDTGEFLVFNSTALIPVDVHGFVTIKGTARYEYRMHMEDYAGEYGVKKVRVDLYWNEEKTGSTSLFLESLIAKDFK